MLDNATPAIHPRWLAHFGQRDLTVFSAIAEEWNLRDLLRHLAETATYVFDKYPQLNVSATVWLDDPTRYELILGAAWNEPVEDPRYLPHHALPYHETDGEAPPKCFEAMKTRRQFPYKNLYADPQPRLVKYLQEQDFRSLVVTPLLDPADATRPALGALNVFARRSQVDFEGERYALQLLSALSWQAGLALRVAVDRRHTRAIAGLRAIAINCGNRDAFLTEAVKLIASPQCLNSPSCAVFLPAGTSAGPLVHLAASTDDTLMSKFEDPKEALHLNYGVGQGLTGASARLGPGHTLRIVRADDPADVGRMERILRMEADHPKLQIRWSNRVPDGNPRMAANDGNRSVMAQCFQAPSNSRFSSGVLRVSRPLDEDEYEWGRYVPHEALLIQDLARVLSDGLRRYAATAQIVGDLAHRHTRDLATILARLPSEDTMNGGTSPQLSFDGFRSVLSGVRIVAEGARRVNEILRPPVPSWKEGSAAPWLVPLDVLVGQLVAARAQMASQNGPCLRWECCVPEGILLPERTATYLGICLNELLTNAANYSLPEDKVTISIDAKRWGQRLFVDVANPASQRSYEQLRKTPSGTGIVDALLENVIRGRRKASYDASTHTLRQRVTIHLAPKPSTGGSR